jgi:pseudouridine-5'-phosphate glycosidase
LKANLHNYIKLSKEVASAREMNAPIVALETTVVTHGLPYPENIELAAEMEAIIREEGVTPATIGVLHGKILIGMSPEELEELAVSPVKWKISRRDFAPVLAKGESGGTTVAGTLIVAKTAGIKVFATGGIGGVHRDAPFDISADLPELSNTSVVVVCAGAKAILDLEATFEYLETAGVPVLGYKTDQLPAFYSRDSGIQIPIRVDFPTEAAKIAQAQWDLGLKGAILVTVPPPDDFAMPSEEAQNAIEKALLEAKEKGISGKSVTPFLLGRVSELTGRVSLRANIGLLHNNARVAAQIAIAIHTNDSSYRV